MYLELLREQCEENGITSATKLHKFLCDKGVKFNPTTVNSYYQGRGVSCVILAEIFKAFGKKLKFDVDAVYE